MKTIALMDRIQSGEILISDGATGTNLQARGLSLGTSAEAWVLERPEVINRLHQDFIAAGANLILTCTFGASEPRLRQSGLEVKFEEINRKAVEIARRADPSGETLVGGSIGPTGHLLQPFGPMEEGAAVEAFANQARILTDAGVDLLVIETQFDLAEARATIEGIRQVSSLPLVCSFSYDRGTRTMMGVRPSQMAQEMKAFDVQILGINCGRSLDDNYKTLVELRETTDLPIWFKPNAGLPELDSEGKAVYSISPETMAAAVQSWLREGVRVLGGCCGTSPQHLAAVAKAARQTAQDTSS